ncbi:MAG: oligoendopeptidase F, partial [Candidatus Marinimicrobia bacterium]|nr:oligoendopeptidase F [Candidatus Neomarinimicrobiota bacterium]
MKSRIILSGILVLVCFSFLFAESDIPQRSEIKIQYQWNLQDIYPSVDAWENDFQTVESGLSEFSEFKGKLKKSGTAILKCLELDSKLSLKLDNLYVYAGLLKDEDTRISENQALNDRARGLLVKYGEATSFILPELQTIPEKKLKKYIDKTPGLEVYRFFFDNLIRQREHTLSSEEEELLAMAGDLFRGPQKIHEALTTTDMVFPMVKDEDGSEIRLTRGRYSKLLLS